MKANPTDRRAGLHTVADQAADYLDSLSTRHVSGRSTPQALMEAMDRPLPDEGSPADQVIRELVNDVETGLTASAGPRYFGFVTGGATTASLMADWLTSTWDQNGQVYATSPAAAAAETVVSRWILELLGLPAGSSVGLVTGCQMANFTALLCARNTVLDRAGWDLSGNGLFGAPPVTVFMSDCGHGTVRSALKLAGFGDNQIREIPSDNEGRLIPDALLEAVQNAAGSPMILSLQAGNVNTGAFEPVGAIADLVQGENAWIHVDGAFGLWAALSPELAPCLEGLERADSWATDAHKWLNVPYDSGIVVVKDPERHRALKTSRCSYAGEESAERRDGSTFCPENSRRARAFVLYAMMRELGRTGLRNMIERNCAQARRFAEGASRIAGVSILNDVVLNQVLFRVHLTGHTDTEALHRDIATRIQSEGNCWLGTSSWKGAPAMRASICNWSTTNKDIDTALKALRNALPTEAGESS